MPEMERAKEDQSTPLKTVTEPLLVPENGPTTKRFKTHKMANEKLL